MGADLIQGIRRVLEQVTHKSIPRTEPLPKSLINSIRMGTTVATNALLERMGRRHALLVTEGFRDFLDIGNQSRPRLFDLEIRKPETLYDEVVEVSERITVEGFAQQPEEERGPEPSEIPGVLVKGPTGDIMRIIKPLDEEEVKAKLQQIRNKGIDTLAICFAHSYLYAAHEFRAAELAAELGFNHVSISSNVGANMIKMVARGSSASADAYLTPEIKKYVETFSKGFEDGNLDGVRCEFMQSDGGLVDHNGFSGLRGILSGPAGLSPKPVMLQPSNRSQVALWAMPEHHGMVKSLLSGLTWEEHQPMLAVMEAYMTTFSKQQLPG